MYRLLFLSTLLFLMIGFFLPKTLTAQTSCPSLPTSTGSITYSTTIPTSGTYKIWSRIKPPSTNAAANAYYLQFGNQCAVEVGDNASFTPAGVWSWVDFKEGDFNQKVLFTLSAGTQTIRAVGSEADVSLDKIIIMNSTDTCIPTGTGDNCQIVATTTPTQATPTAVPTTTRTPTPTPGSSTDTIKPTLTITNPTNGATVQRRGTVLISASATDNVRIDRVTFSVAGNTHTDFSAPYSYSWSVPGKPGAPYTITVTAFDTSNNTTSQSIRVTSSR